MDNWIDSAGMESKPRENRRSLWLSILLLLATTAVFCPVVGHQFLNWDDTDLLTENPGLNPPTWGSVVRFWREPYEGLYTPLSYTFWAVLARVARTSPDSAHGAGLNPHVFHAANLVLHLISALLVYCILLPLTRSA